MLSYQHPYHAGNFADVVKHIALERLMTYLCQKDKPLFYLETHAGRGIYDLQSKEAQQTQEFIQGIQQLWLHQNTLPEVCKGYMNLIQFYNPHQELRYYPGSPAVALYHLRPQDRMFCCELHPQEYVALKSLHKMGKKVHYENEDGIKKLNALLPPIERRGLIFIDPSYEIKSDYVAIAKAVSEGYQRFKTGIYCIWYPIVAADLHKVLIQQLLSIESDKWLNLEFYYSQARDMGMRGCGLWIINPPYVLHEEMSIVCKALTTIINPGNAFYTIQNH